MAGLSREGGLWRPGEDGPTTYVFTELPGKDPPSSVAELIERQPPTGRLVQVTMQLSDEGEYVIDSYSRVFSDMPLSWARSIAVREIEKFKLYEQYKEELPTTEPDFIKRFMLGRCLAVINAHERERLNAAAATAHGVRRRVSPVAVLHMKPHGFD